MMKYLFFAFLLISAVSLVSHPAYANGLSGVRMEKVVGPYLIDIGTDQFSNPEPGYPIQFDFNLVSSETRQYLSFEHVYFSISKDGSQVFEKDLKNSDDGFTAISYTFPDGGTYDLSVKYFKDGKDVADASFPITLTSPPAVDSGTVLNIGIGAAVLAMLGFLIWKKSRLKKS